MSTVLDFALLLLLALSGPYALGVEVQV